MALFPYDIIKEIESSSFSITNFNFSNIFEWDINQRINERNIERNIKIPHNLTLLFKSYQTTKQFLNSNYFSLTLSSILVFKKKIIFLIRILKNILSYKKLN